MNHTIAADGDLLTFGSLFAGIGGIDLGLERAGMRCAWQVEIDDYATRVLTKHWPNVPKYRDVRSVGAHNLPGVDLIAGGFPCQDISYAGTGTGLSGERSGLWFEFARIIRDLRPRYVLVENVAALLHRGLGRVLGDLAEIGYDAEWHCIPAAAIGAPHIRDRVYIVAYANQPECQARCRNSLGVAAPPEPPTCAGDALPYANSQRCQKQHSAAVAATAAEYRRIFALNTYGNAQGIESESANEAGGRWVPHLSKRFSGDWGPWRVEPDVGRVAYGIPHRLDRLRGLGNAVVPQVAEYIGRQILAYEAHS